MADKEHLRILKQGVHPILGALRGFFHFILGIIGIRIFPAAESNGVCGEGLAALELAFRLLGPKDFRAGALARMIPRETVF